MNVEVSKAVELGKQKAFQAFVQVTISPTNDGTLIAASSVNIAEGVVSISEHAQIRYRSETVDRRTWRQSFIGWLLMGGGMAASGYSAFHGQQEQAKANDAYSKYKAATEAEDATANREQVKRHDADASLFNAAALVFGAAAVYGVVYYNRSAQSREILSYKIDVADISVRTDPFANARGFGLKVGFDW